MVNGNVIARTGEEITGKVMQARSAVKLHAPGQLRLQLTSINGQEVRSNAYNVKGKSQGNGNQEAGAFRRDAYDIYLSRAAGGRRATNIDRNNSSLTGAGIGICRGELIRLKTRNRLAPAWYRRRPPRTRAEAANR